MKVKIILCMMLWCLKGAVLQAQLIPQDTAIHAGHLANGFSYYIRYNATPQKRAVIYFVNKVGSILEEDDQQGLAHFLEHMNFNGTRHYPKNQLEDFLEHAGIKFGADLNAYTNYDETVYQLPVPLNNPSMLFKGLDIVHDWTQFALLDSLDIEQERGVILEEERLGLGMNERIRRQTMPVVLPHSRYVTRMPIGLHQVLTSFRPSQLRRFYQNWYRPDLQAVIVVGDIDVKKTENYIRTHFSELKNPPHEKERKYEAVALNGDNHFLAITDKEQPQVVLQVLIRHKTHPLKTQDDYRWYMKQTLFRQLLATRFSEAALQPGNAFLSANAAIIDLPGGIDAFNFEVVPRNGELEPAVRQAWAQVQQVKAVGFTATELATASRNYLANMEANGREADKVSSVSYAQSLQSLFLQGMPLSSLQWQLQFVRTHLPAITTDDINQMAREYIGEENRVILLLGPDTARNTLPDSTTVTNWLEQPAAPNFNSYREEDSLQLLARPPAGSRVVKTDSIPRLGITTVELANGVKIILKPTHYKNDEILFTGFAAGGLSLSTNQNYVSASNATTIISSMGVAGFTPLQLNRLLTGKMANVGVFIGERNQGVQGACNNSDLATALQLTYLRFTQPRKDTAVFKQILESTRHMLEGKYAREANVYADTVNYFLHNYDARFRPFTTARLKELNLDSACKFYQQRFADASAFTFVFVGNFNKDSILPLLTSYLGALPATHADIQARNNISPAPAGRITKKVHAGTENIARVELLLGGAFDYTPVNNLLLYTTGEILEMMLLKEIREKEAEVYTPEVRTVSSKYPVQRFTLSASFGCAPENADHLVAAVEKQVALLRTVGPTASDIQKVKAAYEKQTEDALNTNNFWLSYISTKIQLHERLEDLFNRRKNLEAVTPRAVKEWARIHLSGDNFIRLELAP